MTVELITGFSGTPHINSSDVGAYNAGLVGPGDYALATGDQLKATMSSATTFILQSGDAVLNGRHVHLTGGTAVNVSAGVAGQKRNDIAALRYTRDTTTNIETVQLVIIKGTATTGTPADPTYNKGLITDGVSTHDMPLYRIPLNGITVGTLVPLFNVLKPMADVWDSLTQLPRHIASGFYVGSSNQNGVCLIGYKSPSGRAPDALLVSVGPWDSDNAKGMGVMVWDAGPQAAQVRLMNTRTGEFGGRWPAQFSWIAIWNS